MQKKIHLNYHLMTFPDAFLFLETKQGGIPLNIYTRGSDMDCKGDPLKKQCGVPLKKIIPDPKYMQGQKRGSSNHPPPPPEVYQATCS